MAKNAKRKLLKLDSSKKGNLNSSREVEGTVYYSIEDVEVITQAILAELSSDPSIGVTITPSDTGVTLNCVPENGDEYTVDVDLETETIEDDAVAAEDAAGDADIDSSRRRTMNSSRARNRSRRRMNSSRRKKLNSSRQYFAVPMSDTKLIDMIENESASDEDIYDAMLDADYECSESQMYKNSNDFYYLTWVDDGDDGYLEG